MTSHHYGLPKLEGREVDAWRDHIMTAVRFPPSPGRGAHRAFEGATSGVTDFNGTHRFNTTTGRPTRSALVGK